MNIVIKRRMLITLCSVTAWITHSSLQAYLILPSTWFCFVRFLEWTTQLPKNDIKLWVKTACNPRKTVFGMCSIFSIIEVIANRPSVVALGWNRGFFGFFRLSHLCSNKVFQPRVSGRCFRIGGMVDDSYQHDHMAETLEELLLDYHKRCIDFINHVHSRESKQVNERVVCCLDSLLYYFVEHQDFVIDILSKTWL